MKIIGASIDVTKIPRQARDGRGGIMSEPTKPDFTQAILVLEQDIDNSLQMANLGNDSDFWKARVESCHEALWVIRSYKRGLEMIETLLSTPRN